MLTLYRKFRWLAGTFLAVGLAAEVRGAAAPATIHGFSGFHHTAWNSLGAVFDIKQSSDGYLWLTTSNGVLRFDGVRFQSVEDATDGVVRNGEIDSVFLSSSGGLWLSTEGAGLLFWNDGRLSVFPDRRCTPSRKQGQLIEDRDGSLWVQATAGLFHLRGSVCEQVGANQGYPGGFPAGILLDRDGTLWVKTASGPLLFLPRGQSRFQVNKSGEGLSTNFAFLHQAPDGTIWLSDDQGLRRVTSKFGAAAFSPPLGRRSKRNSQFGDFTFGADGTLWAVSATGLRRFDHVEQWPAAAVVLETAPGETFTPSQGLSSDAAWKVLIDREGMVWVGTNAGLDRLRRSALSTLALPPAQEHEFSIAAGDRGSIWTGNSSLALTHVAADGTTTSFPKTAQIICIRRDHNGTIWAAGAGDFNMWTLSGTGFAPMHYPGENLDAVVAVAVDRNNDPWITTSSGRAYRFSGGMWSSQTEALGKKPGVIGTMVDDQAGNIWFGFSNKVVQWDGASYHESSFPDGQRGVSENTISVRGDHVWLGGAGGIQLFRQGKFYLMRWKDQDLPGRVSGLVETETGDLWVNGFSGITHVSARELKKWLSDPGFAVSGEHLDELDGLPGLSEERFPEPSVVEAPDGRLWFATTKGVAWLDPAAFERNRNRLPPPVAISAVVSNSKAYTRLHALTLPPRTENLEIDYTALSLAIPERVLFRYKLDGVDSDWQNVGTRRQAYYTKLHPGQYTFHVMAGNNDGVWNNAGAILGFNVAPAWFQTILFRIFCVVCGISLVSVLYRLRVRQIAAGISARFDERLAERSRIARELHDTLLQTIQASKLIADSALAEAGDAVRTQQALQRLSKWLDQATQEGRAALTSIRHSVTEKNELADALQRAAEECLSDRSMTLKLTVVGLSRDLHPVVRDDVYRIGCEAIRNACSHSAGTSLEVALCYARDLILRVRDNGRGIDPDILAKGKDGHFGLTGMLERAERTGGKLTFHSKSPGTEVELIVPGYLGFRPQKPRRQARRETRPKANID